MDHGEQTLTQAEHTKQEKNLVRLAQEQLAPVRAWAKKAEQDFLAGDAKLRPRMEAARVTLNRLTALRDGVPAGEPLDLWQKLDTMRQGIPASYRKIIEDIDTLTPWHVGQPNYMIPLSDKPNCPPGSIGSLEAALKKLEGCLDIHIQALPTAQPAPLVTVPVERDQAGVKVESKFDPRR